MSATTTKRASKQFWAVTDDWQIKRVTGYECPPNDRVWWVPSLGCSMTKDFHLFDIFDDARTKALSELSTKIQGLKLAYNQLLEAKEHPNEIPH